VGDACAFQRSRPEIDAAQVGRPKVSVAEVDVIRVQFTQIEPAKITAGEIDRTVFRTLKVKGVYVISSQQGKERGVELLGLVHGVTLLEF
jgi:hypothetical protein